jgi:signal transduction histidine kinase
MEHLAVGIIIILTFVGLLILFCVLFIRLYFRKIKNYTQLIYEKEIESQKSINTAIHETQEQTLNNISQDLHDDAGQQLTYINFQIENLKLDSPEMQATLEPITDSVARLSASVRSISHSLNSQLLLQQDLFKAIRSEVERLEKNTAISISFTTDHTPRDFGNNEKIIIFRIFQETINNCLKHAKAKRVDICLKSKPFAMTISDNGCGFDRNGNSDETLGLHGMVNRAKIIDYSFDIESKAEIGTTVRLTENR